jgi:phenylacetic acid degradation operon negative regulatory protein
MKLPITDEFLWEIFHLSQKAGDILFFLGFANRQEPFVPPSLSIRRIYEKRKAKQKFSNFIKYLAEKGYIKLKSLEPNQGLFITQKGMEKIFKIELGKMEKRKRKDGKWLMVVFDIPERKRTLRDLFRENLQLLGFKFFQKSTWICPWDVLKEVQAIVQQYNLGKYVKIFLIEEISFKK